MGMIWNSPATLEMIRQVNLEFSGDATMDSGDSPKGVVPPIDYWRAKRDLFQKNTKKDLKDIASDNSVTSPTENGHWMDWLTKLGDHKKAASAHEKLREEIYKGLDATYDEIVFVVIPIKRNNKVKVSSTAIDDTFVITVETPTYDTVVESISRRIAKRHSAQKKAVKKKKA